MFLLCCTHQPKQKEKGKETDISLPGQSVQLTFKKKSNKSRILYLGVDRKKRGGEKGSESSLCWEQLTV